MTKTTPPPKDNDTYWDTMTGTNSSNDRLILHQNLEINSNEYFSYDIFLGMKSSTTWNGNINTTSSFVHHFLAIGEFKLSYSPETPNLGQIWRFLEPCDLEIWRITLKNNRAPLQYYFNLCASFLSHWWIQTWVTVQKRPIWVKFDDF